MGRKRIKPEKLNINNLDNLCDLINKKYDLKPNDIGSIEFHKDMTESAIVQICNEHRGIRQLLCGSEPTLKKYLQNILNNKLILNFWNINK